MALGAAAAVEFARETEKLAATPREFLISLWGEEAAGAQREECLRLVEGAHASLSAWTS